MTQELVHMFAVLTLLVWLVWLGFGVGAMVTSVLYDSAELCPECDGIPCAS